MPPGKRRQSNAMLYTLITFVGLFIAATTVAVIYYVKAEELRTTASDLDEQMASLANREEQRNVGAIVGTRLPGQSGLGTMVERLNQMVRLVKGAPVQPTSAEVKVANTVQAVEPLLNRARAFISLPTAAPTPVDPNGGGQNADPNAAPVQVALTTVISDLLAKLDQTTQQKNAAEKQLATLQGRFDDAVATMQETEQALTAKVNSYYQQIQDIKTDYDNLKTLVQQNFGEREKTLLSQLETVRAEAKQLNEDLLKTQAELTVAQGKLKGALAKVSEINPAPDHESTAFKPDGDIILVDEAAGTVRINLGSEDRVYRGLTFSVYDRAGGIPRDGKPKAEIEVQAVDRRASLARILSSEPKNPILTGDLVANLIWDSGKENRFVIAGEFDLNKDGVPDYDATQKIESLIRKWGGEVSDTVTADTDYVILGTEPKVPPEPTLDQQTQDPMAMERYNAMRQMNERYHQIRERAEALWVPIFNYDRFLHFTGYASQIGRPGAF